MHGLSGVTDEMSLMVNSHKYLYQYTHQHHARYRVMSFRRLAPRRDKNGGKI